MTTRLSNVAYLSVLPPAGLDGVGWTVRALSERDYQTVIADIPWFAGLGFTVEANETGGGSVTLDADAPVFTVPLPPAETARIVDQEALWQILEDGQVRFEFLAEDVDEDIVPDSGGPRTTVIAGRGTGSVLEWAPVLPDGFPSAVSSMTLERVAHPMAVWTSLLTAAQAAGYLPFVSRSFDSVTDSRGVPWGPAQALTVNAGDNLLDLLKRWAETNELSWRMLPGFRLEVVQDGGSRRESSVVFTQYRSQGEHKRKITRRDLANVIYADSGDLGLAVAQDSASVTKWHKRAAWVSAGDSGDASALSMVANTSLSLSKDQRLSRSLRIIPDRAGRQPFVDFDVNDWIGVEVPDDDTESGARKVVGLAVQIDSAGVVDFEATLSTRFEVRAVKLQRLMDKLGGSERSGAGGAASSPIPVSKVLSTVKLADLSDVDLTAPAAGALLQFSGGRWVDVVANLDLLADVDAGTIPGSGTVGLLYDRTAGLWAPAALPSGGGASAPSIRATATNYAGTGNVASVTVPGSAVAGDLLIVGVGSNYGYTAGALAAGWAVLPPALNGSFHNMNLFWKVCTAGDIGAVATFTLNGSEPWNTACAVVRDWSRIASYKTVQSTSGTSLTTGAAVLAGKSDLLLLFGTARTGSRVLTFGRGALVAGRSADAALSSTLWTLPAAGGVISETLTSPASTSGLGIGAVAIA